MACALTACAPGPSSTATRTPTPIFENEDAAFAAAEETYRTYNDALNRVDLSDPSTFEPLFALTSGEFEAADRKTLSELHAENYRFVGEMTVARFAGIESSTDFTQIEAAICVDVAQSDVVDASGAPVTLPSRPLMNPLHVTFIMEKGRLLIDQAERDESIACA